MEGQGTLNDAASLVESRTAAATAYVGENAKENGQDAQQSNSEDDHGHHIAQKCAGFRLREPCKKSIFTFNMIYHHAKRLTNVKANVVFAHMILLDAAHCMVAETAGSRIEALICTPNVAASAVGHKGLVEVHDSTEGIIIRRWFVLCHHGDVAVHSWANNRYKLLPIPRLRHTNLIIVRF